MPLVLQDAWPRATALRRDGDFVLFRRTSDRGEDAVLVVEAASEQAAPRTIERLKHEYALSDTLDPSWAAKPLMLIQEHGRSLLVLTDPGGEPLSGLLGRPWNTGDYLRAAIGMSVALSRVHAQGLIHKDLKPDHVLIDPTSGAAWLTGFGIASRLERERQAPDLPETIAGTLAYMAPEQTGRMNRSVDARSDLYALGITLYQMLTGVLPFTANDPMELIHCHIARLPAPPIERAPGTPAAISAIVVKLLAKTAEERYQTASGVAADLQRCLSHWEAGRGIEDFALGLRDMSDRLLIPEKLYGREREVQTLLAAFDRVVRGGSPELVLVSGYSGIGKSSVVNELQKVLVPPRGLYAFGKFDQYKRDIPYSTLAQAFQLLIRTLLAKSDADLAPWRDALHEALGPNGRIVTELVPELMLIIGEQPPVPEIPPQDARARFQLVLRRFIGVFAKPEHPLALFVDDLQWLDAATLDLVEDLLTQSDVKHLMLIGAYRDNEVDPTHPLVRKLKAMQESGALMQDIVLAPLTREDLEQLVAESLHSVPERAGPLAELIHEKTSGNPFFAIQFISGLSDEGLLTFDHVKGRWSWDMNRIHAKGYADNVVDLMVRKLARLPPETQNTLKQLACLGNSAEFAMLRAVYKDSIEHMQTQLAEAIRSGLVLQSKSSFRFLHDRVQEAAYSLIPQELRAETHLGIGMMMALNTPPDKLEEGIFEIVSQLNRGSQLIMSVAERERVAKLDLIAGRRAKIATAYASALEYLRVGRELLSDETWDHNYDLIFSIEYLLAECEFLTTNMGSAENRLSMMAGRANNAHDTVLVTRLRLTLYTALDRSDRAVEVFLEYWKGRGTDWSAHPSEEEVWREYDHIWSLLGTRQIEELVDLPLMTNPDVLDALEAFTEIVTPALFTDARFFALVTCRMVRLSLEFGNSDASCYAYIWLGVLAGPYFGNYQAGFRFGKLACDLVERRGLHRYQIRTHAIFAGLITPWTKHVKTGREVLRRTFSDSNKIGDLTYAAYSCNVVNTNLLAMGNALAEVQREAETGLEFATRIRFGHVIDCIAAQLGLIRTLRGLTAKFGTFDDEHFDELRFERHLASSPASAMPACWYWIRKIQARFLAGDYSAAIEASLNAQALLWASPSFFEVAEYHFYSALARAASIDSAINDSRQQHLEALAAHLKQHEIWAESCPENFGTRAALVAAEIARIEDREFDATRLYEEAIRSARENDFVHNEALAYELAARFYLVRGFEDFGSLYLRKARHRYLRWGADGKVRQLDEAHPGLREEERAIPPTSMIGASVEGLDLATVIKVSQALSSEIVLEKMIDTLMRIAIEHAGAGRGLLILARQGEHSIVAEVTADGGSIDVQMRNHSVAEGSVPQSVYHYVMRTHESVILDDAAAEGPFASDAYIREQRARSVLCLPLLKQATLIGALYLENVLAARAFTPARISVLELLASQAAIALENARLYTDLRSEIAERIYVEKRLRQIVAERDSSEESLRREEALFKQAQHLSSTGSWFWRVAGDIVDFSEQTYAIYELDSTLTVTLDLIAKRIHPEDRNVFQEMIDIARGPATDLDYLYRAQMPDLSVKHLHLVAQGSRNKYGEVEYIGAIQDVTQRHLAEEALGTSRSELAHVARVTTLGALTASIAHEVSQPLAGILMNANTCIRMLASDPPDLDGARETVNRTIRDSNRASDVITRLRALFTKKRTVFERVDLSDTAREVIALSSAELQRYRVTLRSEFADALPYVRGDKIQLQQVILNLVLNALEAMSDIDQARREMVVATAVDEGNVRLSVRDTGIGIDGELAGRLFEAFYTTKSKGMGIGLSISRSIIESHGGRLWVSANQGPGATFSFTVPCAAEALTGREA